MIYYYNIYYMLIGTLTFESGLNQKRTVQLCSYGTKNRYWFSEEVKKQITSESMKISRQLT